MKTSLAIFTGLFLTHLPAAVACVGCRETGLNGTEEPQTITAGIALSWGVVGMLSVVLLIITGLTYYIADTCRRLDRQKMAP
jgi:hypothetical protein